MRLLNFLTEEKDIFTILKDNSLFKLYLSNSNNYIYRGVNHSIETFSKYKRRKDRTPKDMPIEYHKLFDRLFNKKFGWKARSAGVFATSKINATRTYGTPYIFVPEEPFKFIFSPKVADLYSEVADGWGAFLKKLDYAILDNDKEEIKKIAKKKNMKMSEVPTKTQVIDKIVQTYKDKPISQAIKSDSEIVFDCNNYYLINIDYLEKMKENKL